MASVQVHPSAPSPTLRDKIRLFEGRSTLSPSLSSSSLSISSSSSPSSSSSRSNSPYRPFRPSPLLSRSSSSSVGPSSSSSSSPSSSSSLSLSSSSSSSSVERDRHSIGSVGPSSSSSVERERRLSSSSAERERSLSGSSPSVASSNSSASTPTTSTSTSTSPVSVSQLRRAESVSVEVLIPTLLSPTSISQDSPLETPIISPRKWNVITVDPDTTKQSTNTTNTTANTPNIISSTRNRREKGKEKVAVLSLDDELVDSEEEVPLHGTRMMPMLAKSPRRPPLEQKYEDEDVKLRMLTAEEKQLVKTLIKITAKKNELLDHMESDIQTERNELSERIESEKIALSNRLQVMDAELANRTRELSVEAVRNNDLSDKIHKLERERQDIRMALASAKREAKQCKINCETELNKKTQSLMDMAMQLTALTCLRQSMNCVICEEKVAIVVLQPCRHMVMCAPCSQKVSKCPMCRVDIRYKFEIFNNWVL